MEFLSKSSQHLGSVFEIKLPKSAKAKGKNYGFLFELCFDELRRIEKEYSRFIKTSNLSIVNSRLNEWHTVSDEFIYFVKRALEFRKNTNGNFDITVKSTLDNLGYDSNYSFERKREKQNVIARIFSKTIDKFSDDIQINEKNKKIKIRKQIEFGGFGKGYCLDKLAKLIESHGVKNFLVNAGGDIITRTAGKHDWTILLEHPDDISRAFGRVKLNNMAIAASAPNRRRWKEYHHLINAKTRMPQNSVKCIFVLSESGMEADAYSTALFTAGFEEGIKLSMKLGLKIIIVSHESKMYVSPGFDFIIYDA